MTTDTTDTTDTTELTTQCMIVSVKKNPSGSDIKASNVGTVSQSRVKEGVLTLITGGINEHPNTTATYTVVISGYASPYGKNGPFTHMHTNLSSPEEDLESPRPRDYLFIFNEID
jgi:hypothetical protein